MTRLTGPFVPIFDPGKRRGQVPTGVAVGTPPPAPPLVAAYAAVLENIVSIDISDPANMAVHQVWEVDVWFDEDQYDGLAVSESGTILFAVGHSAMGTIPIQGRLHALDISAAPTLDALDTLVDEHLVDAIAIEQNGTDLFVVSETETKVVRVDVTDPTTTAMSVTEVLTDVAFLDVKAMARAGATLLIPVHDVPGHLVSVDTDPALAILDDLTLTDCNSCSDVQVSGSHAFVLGTNDDSDAGSLVAVSLSNPASLAETSTFADAGILGGWNFKISGSHAFIGIETGIVSVNISNPAAMSIVDTVTIPSCTFVSSTAIAGNYLFCTAVIAGGDDAVVAINISDPTNLSIADTVTDPFLGNAGSITAH